MPLQKIARNSVSDAVFEQLSREILEGRMPPGETLPAERALCAVLGVNRGAVREALKRLGQAGLVEVRHGGGATVLDFRNSAGLDMLSGLLLRSDGTVDSQVARSVMEMRAVLGPDVARCCALRRDEALCARLRARMDRMREDHADVSRMQRHDIEFWQLLVEGADNIAYRLAYNSLRLTYERIQDVLAQTLAAEVTDIASHEALVEAVVCGDPDGAKRAAIELLHRGTEPMLALIEWLARASNPPPSERTAAHVDEDVEPN